ncbi:MAG TPA: PEP-utilizing enzyme, partial [Acidimicrobiales bacterium]|nr:PEP-utilizing enzyme [Acidimicrobiales bacterium]
MTSAQSNIDLPFEPPGPGTWELDTVHFPRPATRYWAEMHPEPFQRGVAEFSRYYGMLLGGMQMAYVNSFAYRVVIPVSDEEVPERFQRAEEVFEKKLWREQLREWDETAKPAAVKTHRELQSVDPDSLSDAELRAYLTRCRDHHIQMIYQHMRFTGAAMICVGDLLAHLTDWTMVPPSEVLAMTRGSAPVSAGASGELDRLITAFSEDAAAREILESEGDPGQVLDKLRSLGNQVSQALSGYLDLVGYRLLDGFDISGRYALELPDALLRAIRTSVQQTKVAADDVDERISAIREQVPEEHRAQFDELLGEARLMYRIRDERGVFSDIWASGIARRAVLAVGRRLARTGAVHDPEHAIDAGFDEMISLLSGSGGPSADELAARHQFRTTHSAKDAPPVLGPPAPPPPDPSGLPPGEARLMRATMVALGELFGSSQAPQEEKLLRGLAASGGVYEGPARRVSGPAEFDRIVQGDVLVTESTTEAFNILLPLLGAIVTDSGGLLSHSAIVAREYGIPGVVGTREATDRIPDGATVRVDGD